MEELERRGETDRRIHTEKVSGERERETGRSSIHWFAPQMAAMAWIAPNRSMTFILLSRAARTHILGSGSVAFSVHLTRELDQKWRSRILDCCSFGMPISPAFCQEHFFLCLPVIVCSVDHKLDFTYFIQRYERNGT